MRAARGVVLIVAEDALAREVYAELFAMRGYGVATAAGAREGLKRARDRAVTIAVVAMSSGGPQLRRKLQAIRPSLRVHVTGLVPLPLDLLLGPTRQRLLH
jgi:ActR/RegA family two-component response regulator